MVAVAFVNVFYFIFTLFFFGGGGAGGSKDQRKGSPSGGVDWLVDSNALFFMHFIGEARKSWVLNLE